MVAPHAIIHGNGLGAVDRSTEIRSCMLPRGPGTACIKSSWLYSSNSPTSSSRPGRFILSPSESVVSRGSCGMTSFCLLKPTEAWWKNLFQRFSIGLAVWSKDQHSLICGIDRTRILTIASACHKRSRSRESHESTMEFTEGMGSAANNACLIKQKRARRGVFVFVCGCTDRWRNFAVGNSQHTYFMLTNCKCRRTSTFQREANFGSNF